MIINQLPAPRVRLKVDAMYHHAAIAALSAAKMQIRPLKESIAAYRKLEAKERSYRRIRNPSTQYDKLESIAIQIEQDARPTVESHNGKYIENIALVHILCVASLEAYMNAVSRELLDDKLFNHFERMSLDGKFLFLPELLTKKTFDKGRQPFQDLAKLIRIRNDLVHYKSKWVEYGGELFPKLISTLSLTLRDARRSIATVSSVIKQMAAVLEIDEPHWLQMSGSYFLDVEYSRSHHHKPTLKTLV